jgi:hypothetical protein
MPRASSIGALSLLLTSFVYTQTSALSPTQAPAEGPSAPAVAPFPRAVQVFLRSPVAGCQTLVQDATDGDTCYGIVTAVDAKSITVADGGKIITRYIPVPGQPDREEVTVIPPKPSRLFIAFGPLANGGHLEHGTPSAQYRLSDVKVGDKVFFDWWRFEGVDYVHYVKIDRRPGGKVPPSPAEKPDEKNPWHEKANAYQELEEKGTPLPEKFRPKLPPQLPPPSVPQ